MGKVIALAIFIFPGRLPHYSSLLVNTPHVSRLGGGQRCVYSLNIKLGEIKERDRERDMGDVRVCVNEESPREISFN